MELYNYLELFKLIVDGHLINKIDNSGKDERVIFVRTGTHAELFE